MDNNSNILQRNIGIIGCKISHTMSPAMHTAAFQKKGLNFVYGVFDVNEDMLPAVISSLKKQNFRGANVTVPYKKTVMPFLDTISEEAAAIGAVNTIVNNNGLLEGHNTDAFGVLSSLLPFRNDIAKKEVVIIGAGGGARSVAYIVGKHFSPPSIAILNRTVDRAVTLAEELAKKFPAVRFSVIKNDTDAAGKIENAALIVNTTTIGMTPKIHFLPIPVSSVLKNSHIVFDIIYNPLQTLLMKTAQEKGARTIGGIEMLIGQGIRAFELFTGGEFPVDIARETVLRELKAAI